MQHKHKFCAWKKLIFEKIRWCKGCDLIQKKPLVFKDEKR